MLPGIYVWFLSFIWWFKANHSTSSSRQEIKTGDGDVGIKPGSPAQFLCARREKWRHQCEKGIQRKSPGLGDKFLCPKMSTVGFQTGRKGTKVSICTSICKHISPLPLKEQCRVLVSPVTFMADTDPALDRLPDAPWYMLEWVSISQAKQSRFQKRIKFVHVWKCIYSLDLFFK